MKICGYCNNPISDKKYDNHIVKHQKTIEISKYKAERFNEAKTTISMIENYLTTMDIDAIEGIDLSSVIFCILNGINRAPCVKSSKINIRSNEINKIPETYYKIKSIDARVAYKKLYFTIVYDGECVRKFYSTRFGNGNIQNSKNLKIVFDTPYDIDQVPIPHRLWFKSKVKSKLLTEAKVFHRNIFRIYEGE